MLLIGYYVNDMLCLFKLEGGIVSTVILYSLAFCFCRVVNWLLLGIIYVFLYMGCYNIIVVKYVLGDLMSLEQFGTIFGVGIVIYAFSFLVNGFLIDRIGG